MNDYILKIIDIHNQGCRPAQIESLLKVLRAHVNKYREHSADVALEKAIITPFDVSWETLYFRESVNIWCATCRSAKQRLRVVIGFNKA